MSKEWGKYHFEKGWSAAEVVNEVVINDLMPLIKRREVNTLSLYREAVWNYRTKEFEVLEDLARIYHPKSVLYVGSGEDPIPKFIYGKSHVVHTSLENGRPTVDRRKYFPALGEGLKVVTDNKPTPFASNAFDLVLILDTWPKIYGEISEYVRLLKMNGLLLIIDDDFMATDNSRIILANKQKKLIRIETSEEIGLYQKIR